MANNFHGGQEVFSKKHGKNIHIMMACHAGNTLTHYLMVDGTKLMPDEVEEPK